MKEYPTIINSSKAPRKHCIAFDKLDGSNFRAKWTQMDLIIRHGMKVKLCANNKQVTKFRQHAGTARFASMKEEFNVQNGKNIGNKP